MPAKLGGSGGLLALLLVAWCLRVVLVLRGGQCYFPDETRYFQCWGVLEHLARGELGGACDVVVGSVAHCFYTVLCCGPAVVQCGVAWLGGRPIRWVIVRDWLSVSALVLSLASVVCIGLTYAVARRAGGDRREGLAAALLMACSSSMFYYARHLLPYDASMALALLALWIGLGKHPGPARSAWAGAVAGLAFLTYYGYWLMAVAVTAIHVLGGWPSWGGVARRGLAAGLGFVAPVALVLLLAVARGSDLPASLLRFPGTVTQGDFKEGWSLPWVYLWHAEHGLLLVWGLGAPAILLFAGRASRNASGRVRGLRWLATAFSLYLVLAAGSTGMERMVVYGRLARQVVPFFCLGTACALTRLLDGRPLGRGVILGTLVLLAQAAFNFGAPLALHYPGDVLRRVEAIYGPVARGLTFEGPRLDHGIPDDPFRSHERPGAELGANYLMLNAQFLYPIEGLRAPPRGEILVRVPHPEGFFPYQYEGFGGRERALLRAGQTVMELIDTHGRP
ncbi:glycosyltransferase family 39 protein [Singulisphaera acidiphila]|uniref:Glycosyltransferase RgtA/B/C/D-like domain-containing protein n=1 Tax=Singulisphaera acidiphila (strain ATCC BAA-1392 / DSM 18658 / VKM B-2454 / MOB10) TaxID=886293 RepID=L0DI01_SINAD|nr:glycosyltransferase family 39 protein [Singulisphaera acidiphila]AGA28480.1 hypothetical protein Sinac_4281 [Singulisphaera acidiphila DSM 18658]